jgi:hypothetical protein
LSISGQGSGSKEEGKEEQDEGNRPHQRRRVDHADADNKNHGEVLDVPREIDFEAFAMNPVLGNTQTESILLSLCTCTSQSLL